MSSLPDPQLLLPGEITAGLSTKADQIRALAHAGYPRAEIARHLEIRYQHVRNVLERSGISLGLLRPERDPAAATDAQCTSAPKEAKVRARVPAAVFPPSRLVDAGFVRIGQWISTSEQSFELDAAVPAEAGVYAFVVDGVIRYIGLTQRGLRGRMTHYVSGHARQRTSARVKGLILDTLRGGGTVEVLIATPATTDWNGLPVVIAPGLEAGLIRLIQPAWNMQGLARKDCWPSPKPLATPTFV